MNLTALDGFFIVAYFVGLLLFGVLVRRVRSFADYAVAERRVPAIMVFASLAAAYIGPGYTFGVCGKGADTGWLFYFATLAFGAQTLLVGLLLAPRLQTYKHCHTVGEVMAHHYGRWTQVVTGVLSFFACVGFVAIMGRVGGEILEGSAGVPLPAGVLLVTGIGVLYTFTGGIKSVIATEALQFSLFAVIIPVMLFAVAAHGSADIAAASAAAATNTASSAAALGPAQVVGLVVAFLLGETLIPPYVNRALASGSPMIARKGFVFGAVFSVAWGAIVTAIGIVGHQALPSASGDGAFMAIAAAVLPHGLLGLVVVALAAIIMSSQESVLNAGAVSFAIDVVGPLRTNALADSHRIWLSRAVTLVAAVLATVAALFSPGIIEGLLIIYSLWAPTVLLPLILALLLRRVPAGAALPSIVSGGLASLAWRFLAHEAGGIPSIVVGIVANLLVFGLAAALKRSHSPQRGPGKEDRS